MFRPSWFYVYIVSCCYSILSLRDGWVMLLVYRIVVATAALTFAGPLVADCIMLLHTSHEQIDVPCVVEASPTLVLVLSLF